MTQEVWNILAVETVGEDNWDINELHHSVKRSPKAWSWGANSFKTYDNKVYSFKVQGFLLKWYVHIVLDFSDTFTVYFTKLNGKIIERVDMVYIEDLLNIIDTRVETRDNYGQG